MHIKPTQKTTNLGSDITFAVHDFQGDYGFPQGQGGLVFEHLEKRVIRCKYSGQAIGRNARYVIRTAAGEEGWRIDLMPPLGPIETVYGLDRETHWASNTAAAKALSECLDDIRDNSSLA
jgi:hypothetical protein